MARVVVLSLASDFGCQVQMTNIEDHLLDVLGAIDLQYWQLAASGHLPAEYDVAVIEGAVTTDEHVEVLRKARETAAVVIAIGTCAITGGIPAIAASGDFEARAELVYGEGASIVAPGRTVPAAIDSVIEVDYRVPGCPIEPTEFVTVLHRALQGLSDPLPPDPMCASCKIAENVCFYERGEICLGLITRAGCGTKCISLGRPCAGCRGVAADANLESAKRIVEDHGFALSDLLDRARLYNNLREDLS